MKIPFITEIKELKGAISEAEGEIIFLKEETNKMRIQIAMIEILEIKAVVHGRH